MVHERPDERLAVTATIPADLADAIEQTVANDPELTEARLVREALRRELQDRETFKA